MERVVVCTISTSCETISIEKPLSLAAADRGMHLHTLSTAEDRTLRLADTLSNEYTIQVVPLIKVPPQLQCRRNVQLSYVF